MNQEYDQFMIDTLLMLACLAYGLWQRYDNIPEKVRWRARPFSGGKGQHIGGCIAMTKGSIQATHPVIAHNFEAEKRLAFPDELKDTIGELPERREAQFSPRQPHTDYDRH
ncbi:MAG: hypothetical protein LZF60_90065 [Nitrospira sp.]|nr:MAG: hypothetical protein LZF60_90065 [Nitrospira sp.]